jgi:hypothetical protein
LPKTPSKLTIRLLNIVRFVDETQDVQDIYGNEDETRLSHPTIKSTTVNKRHEESVHQESSAVAASHSASVSPYLEGTEFRDVPAVSDQSEDGASTFPKSTDTLGAATVPFADPDDVLARGISTANPPYCVDIESPLFPLKVEQEVLLMRHYIDHMCRWVGFSLSQTTWKVYRRGNTSFSLQRKDFN